MYVCTHFLIFGTAICSESKLVAALVNLERKRHCCEPDYGGNLADYRSVELSLEADSERVRESGVIYSRPYCEGCLFPAEYQENCLERGSMRGRINIIEYRHMLRSWITGVTAIL